MGVGLFTVIWAIKKAIFYPVSESGTILEIQPAKFNPQIYWLEIVDNRIQLTPKTAYTAATTSQVALKQAFTELLHTSPSSISYFYKTILLYSLLARYYDMLSAKY
jgi:spore germination protein GerM